jgi:hypothetical protein
MEENSAVSSTQSLLEHVAALERRIVWLEDKIQQFEGKIPTTNLISSNFLYRAFAVWGHMVVAQLLIVIPLYCLLALLGLR